MMALIFPFNPSFFIFLLGMYLIGHLVKAGICDFSVCVCVQPFVWFLRIFFMKVRCF